MPFRKSDCVLLLLLMVCLACANSFAQVTGGSIVGNVTDASGGVVPGATVHARNVGTNAAADTITNEAGYFEFPILPVGRYILSVQQSGFQRSTTAEFTLHAGTKPRIDLQLKVGQLSESVEVVASAPLVNATSTELGVVIDAQKVRDLPLNGRTFTQLLALQPGFNTGGTASRGGVELNGLGGLSNNWLVDGVDASFGENNGIGIGAIGGTGAVINTVSIDAIEEFKTSSGGFSADYGRAAGGVINLTTKSGTNRLHGTAFEYFRNDKLDANSFFSNRSGLKKPPLRHNQFGGNLGGPLWKDKIFFFFNYEGTRIRRSQFISGNVPTPALLSQITNPKLLANLQIQPTDFAATSNPLVGLHSRNDVSRVTEDTTLSRVDANLKNHRISFRMIWNNQLVDNPAVTRNIRQFFPIPLKNYSVSDTFILSPKMTNEVRYGYNHYPIARHFESTLSDGNAVVLGKPQPKVTTAVNVSGLARTFIFNLLEADSPSHSFIDNFVWIRGAHTVKAGFDFRHVSSIRNQNEPIIYYYNTISDLIKDNPLFIQLTIGNPGRGYDFANHDLYVQDDWKVNRRLQVNFGLRYEYNTVFKGPYGLATGDPFGPRVTPGQGIWNPDRNNFGPRMGVVFDVTGKGRTILRSGISVSYSPPQPYWYWDAPFIDPRLSAFPNVNAVDLPANLKPLHFGDLDYSFSQGIIADPSKIPAGLTAGFTLPTRDRRDPYAVQWNLSLQHQVSQTIALQASYVGNRAVKMNSDRVLNLIDPKTGIRAHADVGAAILLDNAGRLWYHGLQLTANKRLSHGLNLDAYYSFSKTMEYGAADLSQNIDMTTQDFSNIAGSMGPKVGSVAHRFSLVHSYQIPALGLARKWMIGRSLFSDWTIQGIMGKAGGGRLNITAGRDNVGNGRINGQRPDAVPGVSQYTDGSNRLLLLNRAAYDSASPTAQKRFGNLGFATAIGPGAFTWDLAIHKSFPITERQKITFRVEMFNCLNHVVFNNPVVNVSSATFGQITTGGNGRNIQFALKYSF